MIRGTVLALALPPDAPAGLLAWLARIDPQAPCRRTAGRELVRRILAAPLGMAPHAVELRHSGARPTVVGRSDVAISLAYAGDWVAVAVHGNAVGIDVERIVPHAADALVAEMLLPEMPTDMPFFTRWTLMEASLKAADRGLADSHNPMPPNVRAWPLDAPAGLAVAVAVAG